MKLLIAPLVFLLALYLCGCDYSNASNKSLLPEVSEAQRTLVSEEIVTNLEAPVPPQCYTKTESRYNPCFTCHQIYDRSKGDLRMNQLDDGGLQGGYIFSDEGLTNHWKNLFIDRSEWVKSISDEDIQTYVNQDNYSQLAPVLKQRAWKGFIPDLKDYDKAALAFDAQGIAKDGSHWIAFNYKPFPGTFWPSNGSTDDVLIRLPEQFRQLGGIYNRDIYLLNLLLVELAIKNAASLPTAERDENLIAVDLDGDGKLHTATRLKKRNYYLGDASNVKIAFQQYPEGSELMHSVRYIGSDEAGNIHVPARMKELRYMKKIRVLEPYDLESRYARERKEKAREELPNYANHGELGMENGMGWMLQAYIEDYQGMLRPQTYEEKLGCMGCHAAIGATIDQTFALARKIPGDKGLGYVDLKSIPDVPSQSESGGEILHYFQRAGGGSEFRENPEMFKRWFKEDGSVDVEKVAAADVYQLITPSRERALMLNKAYTHTVRHQSYIYGKDATVAPVKNVFTSINEDEAPLANEFRFYNWDIRLDWKNSSFE
jgi:hypothetical protein